jgi:hypothetical protein
MGLLLLKDNHILAIERGTWGFPGSQPYMALNWRKDVDEALEEASTSGKPALLDFSAAPG